MKKNMVVLSLLLVGSYELMATNITPFALAQAKGYTKIVAFFTEQAKISVPMGVYGHLDLAGETVYILNSSKSEAEALTIIKTMYWPLVGASCGLKVPSDSKGWGATGEVIRYRK